MFKKKRISKIFRFLILLQIFIPTLIYTSYLGDNYLLLEENSKIFDPPLLDTGNLDSNWIPFIPGASPGTPSEVLPKSRDTMGLCVDSNFFGMYNLTNFVNGTLYNYLNVPSAGHSTELGKPAVPVMTQFLEIPHDVNVSFRIIHENSQIIDGFNIIPAQEPWADYSNATKPPFAIDEITYSTNAFFPLDVASIDGKVPGESIIIRGHRILALSLYPVQFNPVTQHLRVYSKIEVRLDYSHPSQVKPIDDRLVSTAFEALCQGLILNYQYNPITTNQENSHVLFSNNDGAEYLIITHDDFYQEVLPLAEWKEKKGLKTKIVNTSDISSPTPPTANDIATYIQNAYDNWNLVPNYVLLVGDSEFIPPHYRTIHPAWEHNFRHTATDLYYGTLEGTDYFPEIYVGRLSVDTPIQASIVIDKILNYEKTPPTDKNFYTHVAACAQFQDDDLDGYEDRRFILTSEEIRDFLQDQAYNVHRIYNATTGSNPTNYSDDLFFNFGEPLPDDLLMANGFGWNGDTPDITSNLTDGRFLIFHRDHGNSENWWLNLFSIFPCDYDGWDNPHYDTTDIAGLTNDPLLPVVFSIECMGAWYDGETDQTDDPGLTRNNESFCEEFVRKTNGGAIAAIGASRISYSGYNDVMVKGFIDAIWPSFDDRYAPGDLFSLGQVLTYGKLYMSGEYGLSHSLLTTFELFQLFGDPEMSIWTNPPEKLNVTHPLEIGSLGQQEFVVGVLNNETGEPVHHAKVCLQKGSDIYEVAYTDPTGHAYFSIFPISGGDMNITVTQHNYIPYEELINVTDGGAILTVEPLVGPGGISVTLIGSNFVSNEIVDIYIEDISTFVNTIGGSFSNNIDIPVDGEGPINIIAIGRTSGRAAVTLFRRLSDGTDLYIYCQWNDNTWDLNPEGAGNDVNPRWNNPCIQLFDKITKLPVASNDLEINKTYILNATIYNNAAIVATDTVVTFEWAFWGAGQKNWNLIGTDTVSVPAAWGIVNWVPGRVTATTDWTPSRTGHTCLMVTLSHVWDLTLDDNYGQENTDVHPVSSPGEVSFTIFNPTDNTGLIYLDAKQVGSIDNIWGATIERAYPQDLDPGENQTVTITFDVPDWAQNNETHTFTIDAYINGEMIGGIEISVKKVPPEDIPPIPWWVIVIIGSGVIVLITVVIVLLKRKKIKMI